MRGNQMGIVNVKKQDRTRSKTGLQNSGSRRQQPSWDRGQEAGGVTWRVIISEGQGWTVLYLDGPAAKGIESTGISVNTLLPSLCLEPCVMATQGPGRRKNKLSHQQEPEFSFPSVSVNWSAISLRSPRACIRKSIIMRSGLPEREEWRLSQSYQPKFTRDKPTVWQNRFIFLLLWDGSIPEEWWVSHRAKGENRISIRVGKGWSSGSIEIV